MNYRCLTESSSPRTHVRSWRGCHQCPMKKVSRASGKGVASVAADAAARLICGVDESGRGSVMGPLVIVGLVMPLGMTEQLKDMGVRDSKALSASKRESLHSFLTTHGSISWASTHVSSEEIDMRRRRQESLNEIESSAMLALSRRLYREARFDVLQLDSIESNAERFERPFRAVFAPSDVHVTAECGADVTLVAVSAASIVAKVERDRAIALIASQEGGSVGSGYPSDPATKAFFSRYFREHGRLPAYIRHTWNIEKSYL